MERSSYELRVEPSARRSLDRIPYRYAFAIREFIVGPLTRDPWRVGGALEKELAGWRAARVGPYRIVYRIDEDARVIRVDRIEHRHDVYRTR